jgi:anion-transporting  ArsA/GET3 family ATPase
MTTVRDVVDRHRLVVCVGTGGVGKTTVSAALALAAARRGRRVMVLTIDPARALARALGLTQLAPGGEPVPAAALAEAGVALAGSLDAGMLDQKQAWDAFVRRHAPDPRVAAAILGNAFYQTLSTSFAGSTEYMAIEEMCRLADSGRYDLIVLDTPPAAHALDFLRAPERVAPLLERSVVAALSRPAAVAGTLGRFVLRHLESATGSGTLRELSSFFVAAEALVDIAAERARHAADLLHDGRAAFVLVAGPRDLVLAETGALAARMAAAAAPLAAVVLNRVQPRWPATDAAIDDELAALSAAGVAAAATGWLRSTWTDARAAGGAEDVAITRFAAALPAGLAVGAIAEGDGDVHTLRALAAMADRL